jgi:hypothetical protein
VEADSRVVWGKGYEISQEMKKILVYLEKVNAELDE